MHIANRDLQFELHRLRRALAFTRLQTSLLAIKYALTERDPFDFLSAASKGPTLLVGEGNLSFALSLASKVGSQAAMLKATTYEGRRNLSEDTLANATKLCDMGAKVLHGVDARRLEESFPATRFKLVAFQFPNVASRKPLYGRNANHVLVRRFLRSALQVLANDGLIAITAIDSPHYDGAFAMHDAAEWAGLPAPSIYPFRMSDHPGYVHSNTQDENESALDASNKLQTYVFGR